MESERAFLYADLGEMKISEANGMNVPVGVFTDEMEDGSGRWELTADNFMPRKNFVAQGQYHVVATDKETLLKVCRMYIVPLYQAAVDSLTTQGKLYYFETKLD